MFEAAKSQTGGIVNCPNCGKATTIEGLRDPLWRLLQCGVGLGVVLLVMWLAPHVGPVVAVLAGAALSAASWLVSRAL